MFKIFKQSEVKAIKVKPNCIGIVYKDEAINTDDFEQDDIYFVFRKKDTEKVKSLLKFLTS